MKIIRNIDPAFWWAVAEACPYATFFHSPLWHSLIEQTYDGYMDTSLGIEFDDGRRAVFPLLQTSSVGRGLFHNAVSTFAGCYGGIIADGDISHAESSSICERLVSWNIGHLSITGNPIKNDSENPGRLFERQEDFTQIIDLKPGFEKILSNFSKGHASGVKKARRMGVATRIAESLEDYRAYWGAYEDSLRRWGKGATSHYPWRLFENGYGMARKYPKNIKLWLSEVEGKLIGGAWVFYWNNHVVWWHGASYEDHFGYCPNNVLQNDILQDACESGYRYYDFNPSGGHEGVARFKSHFGAEKRYIGRWTHEGTLCQSALRLGSAIHSAKMMVRGKTGRVVRKLVLIK